jgi:type I restriction enzyme, S subunit
VTDSASGDKSELTTGLRRFKPYPEYRESGIEWLAEVPTHWEVRRLKHLCDRAALYGANEPSESYATDGVRFLRTTDITDSGELLLEGVYLPIEYVRAYLLDEGDLLFSRSGTIGRSFVYEKARHGPCAYAGYLVRFVPSSSLWPNFRAPDMGAEIYATSGASYIRVSVVPGY